MENFAHGHGEERHCHTLGAVLNISENKLSGFKEFSGIECDNGQKRYKNTLIEAVDAKSAGKNSVVLQARLSSHDIAFRFFKSERKSGEAVGNKIDEKQVWSLKNCEIHYRRKENGENLGKVKFL